MTIHDQRQIVAHWIADRCPHCICKDPPEANCAKRLYQFVLAKRVRPKWFEIVENGPTRVKIRCLHETRERNKDDA